MRTSVIRNIATAFAVASIGALAAPLPVLKDINRVARTGYMTPGKPVQTAAVPGGWVLTLCGGGNGNYDDTSCGPWFTDGTPGSARRIPGFVTASSPMNYAEFSGTAYFSTTTGKLGKADAVQVSAIATPRAVYPYAPIAFLGSKLHYFDYFDKRLWRIDADGSGAEPLIADGPTVPGFPLTALVGSTLFFTGTSTANGAELWKTDGTLPGTSQVKDITTGAASTQLADLTAASNRLLFVEHRGTGEYLWGSDGTDAGTQLLMPLAKRSNLVAYGGKVYLLARSDANAAHTTLYATDGTLAGTLPIRDFEVGEGRLGVAGGILYFAAKNLTATSAWWLWRSDGTSAGTTPIVVVPGSYSPSAFVDAGGTLYFELGFGHGVSSDPDDVYGPFWKSDGTASGTVQILPDGFHVLGTLGARVLGSQWTKPGPAWVSDGTTAGTVPLDVASGEDSPGSVLCGSELIASDGSGYFLANDGIHGCELWKTDGTAAGTVLVKEIRPGWQFGAWGYGPFAEFKSRVYFEGFTGNSDTAGLFITNGTAAGTSLVANTADVRNLGVMGDSLYFTGEAPPGSRQYALWKTDGNGTPAGTVQVQAIAGPVSQVERFVVAANRLYFWVNSGASQYTGTLWKSDGTAAGTVPISTFPTVPFFITVPLGDDLIFNLPNPVWGSDLWHSDGTPEGTATVPTPPDCANPFLFMGVVNGGVLYSTGGADGLAPWRVCRTDGTAAGTYALGEIDNIRAGNVTVLDGRAYFLTPTSLFSTSGVPGDMRRDFDFTTVDGPGNGPGTGSNLETPVAIRGTLYILRESSSNGVGLWASSGSSSVRLGDLPPVSGSYSPWPHVIELANGLLALATHPAAGAEPVLVAFDGEPDPLMFAAGTNVPTHRLIESAPARVVGTNVATPVTAADGEFCVSSGNACTCDVAPYAASGRVGIGQYLCVRHPSSAAPLTSVTTQLSVGGVAASFTSTTAAVSPPTLYFDPGHAVVAEAGSVTLQVFRAGSHDEAVSVDYFAVDEGATAGVDYGLAGQPAPSGSLSWPAGDGSPKTITIPINADDLPEPTESFRVHLANPMGGAVVGAEWPSKIVDITDGVAAVAFRYDAATIREEGPNREVVVVRTGNVSVPATVSFRTVNGTAVAGQDFGTLGSPTAVTGTLAFGVNEIERRIAIGPNAAPTPYIPIINDPFREPDKALGVELFDPTPGMLISAAASTMQIVISSEEAGIFIEKANYVVSEGGLFAHVGVVRAGRAPLPAASVNYATSNGTAVSGTHYSRAAGRLDWAAGETGTKFIHIPLIDNSVPNIDRSFTVALSTAVNASLPGPSVASVKLVDNDGTVQFSRATAVLTEGTSALSLTVNRNGGDGGAGASVDWAIVPGTALPGVDFGAVSGTFTWAPGDVAARVITIPILDDAIPEPTKTFTVMLQSAAGIAIVSPSSVVVTLADNDPSIAFVASGYTVSEATQSVVLNVGRLGPVGSAASVKWSTADGSAIAGQDFGISGNAAQRSGTLTWAAGDAAPKPITVPILQDSANEGQESFTVTLSAPSAGSALIAPSNATVTITDDDIPLESQISFSQPKYIVLENAGNAVLTVKRDLVGGGFTVPATANYATQPGSAVAPSDYTTRAGTISWAAGDGTDKSISIPIVNDTVAEPPESFKVTLNTSSPGAQVTTPDATVTIVDDDDAFAKYGAVPGDWTVPVGASAGWHAISDPGAFEGVYSLRSDAIIDNGTAQVEVTRAFTAGNVSFRVKISSEPNFDRLRFFVDGIEKGSWSGTAVPGWTLFTTLVTSGNHTLRWSYEKDGSASVGSDAAWIDAVTLP